MDTKRLERLERLENQTVRNCVYSGAIQGFIAWTVYAAVECLFSSILPWIIKPGYDYKPFHWKFTALLFVLYPAVGLILGGLSGFCIRKVLGRITFLKNAKPTVIFSAAAISTVVLVFALNLVRHLQNLTVFNLTVSALVLISMLMIFGLVLSGVSGSWSRRLSFIVNPWITSILLVGLSWLTLEKFDSIGTKCVSALTYVIMVLLFSFFLQRILDRRQIDKPSVPVSLYPIKSLAYPTLALLVTFGISLFAKDAPLQVDSSVKQLPMDANHPNIILITMDTVRANHLSLHGYERDTTPNLKKFADEATLYTRAIASSDMTLSTHASIFTGMYARWHKAHIDPWSDFTAGRPLAAEFNTVAEAICEKGYLTMGVVSNVVFLTHDFGMDQGFLYYDERVPVQFFSTNQEFYLRQGINNVISLVFPPDHELEIRKAEGINREVFTLLDKVKKDDVRFFLFLNYMDAHWPYIPPPPFDSLYPGKKENFTSTRYDTLIREVLKLERKVTEEEYNHLISQYDGGIAYIDFHLEKLITRLKELGLYENCLIIITSDHGEAFGERNLVEHGVSVYQDQIYIPLIIKYPNITQQKVVDELVSVIDLAPTIMDVLNFEIPKNIQGKSLMKLGLGESRSVISESYPESHMINWHDRFNRVERAIFLGPYKFISSTAGKKELYNLLKDPNEKEDLFKVENKIARDLDAKLNQWIEMAVPELVSPTKVILDKDAIDRLKALGYIR